MMGRVQRGIALVVLLATVAVAPAQTADTPDQLDTLVAPIALYPDALVANILPASTFPVQIVEAERVVQSGTPAQDELSQWDPSIQALASNVPSVLKMMNDRLSWTTELGQQVAANQGAVMAAIQRVRAKAQAAGNLGSNDRQTVTTQGDTIIIQPTNPQVIYVPQYDPVAIFAPPPAWGYYPAGYGVLSFGAGFSAGFFAGYACDWGGWGGGYSHITINNNYYRNTNIHVRNTTVNGNVTKWTPPSDVGRIRRGDSLGSSGDRRAFGDDGQRDGDRFGDGGGRRDDGGFGDGGGRRDDGGFGGGRRDGGGGGFWGAFHGAGGDGWNQRAFSDRGDRSFGGGGFGGGGFGRRGGFGGGGWGGGGRGRR